MNFNKAITKKVLLLKVIVLLLNNRKQILVKSAETQTISSIARNCSVSVSTVQRIINEEVKRFKFSYQTFPQHFSMVECNYGKVIEYVKAETS